MKNFHQYIRVMFRMNIVIKFQQFCCSSLQLSVFHSMIPKKHQETGLSFPLYKFGNICSLVGNKFYKIDSITVTIRI